jgi:hypothetical protein
MTEPPDIRWDTDTRPCQRCTGTTLLHCSIIADRWETPTGPATSVRHHTLCQRCDIDSPDAGPLIAFLAVHSPIGPETVAELGVHLNAWLERLTAPADPSIADSEWLAWRSGAFDE